MAAKDLVDEVIVALAAIQTNGAQSLGIRKAFEYAPTLVSPLPAFVNFYQGADRDWPRTAQGMRESVLRVQTVALVALQADSANAERIARPIDNGFTDLLDQHKQLDNLVTAGEVIEAAVVASEYGPYTLHTNGETYLGVEFDVRVRVMEIIKYRSTGA